MMKKEYEQNREYKKEYRKRSTHLQEVVGLPDVTLERGSGGEVARPVAVVPRRVGEEIVALRGPREAGVVQGLQVAGRGRVEHVDL